MSLGRGRSGVHVVAASRRRQNHDRQNDRMSLSVTALLAAAVEDDPQAIVTSTAACE